MSQTRDIWEAYRILPVHAPFHKSDAKIRLLAGSLGSGKTQSACWEMIRLVTQKSGAFAGIARKERKALINSTLRTLWTCLDTIPWVVADHNKTDHIIKLYCTDGGISEIYYQDLDDPDKFRSYEYAYILIDELKEIKSQEIFANLCARVRQQGYEHKIICVTNTDIPKAHWVYQDFVERPSALVSVHMSNVHDNPFLPPGYVDTLRATLTADQQESLIEGRWGVAVSARSVYPMFRRDFHIKKIKHNPNRHIIRGWDFGFNTATCVLAQQDEQGRIIILDCVYSHRASLDAHMNAVTNFCNRNYITNVGYVDVGDIAIKQHSHLSDKSGIDLMRENGIDLICHSQTIKEGITIIQKLLETLKDGHPMIIFNSGCCGRVLEDFVSYHYEDKLKHNKSDYEPIHDDTSHFNDALRYLVYHLYRNHANSKGMDDTELARYLLNSQKAMAF